MAGGSFDGDGGEGGGLAGFHGHAAEVDGAAEGAFDGGFEEVEFAHGDAAGGYYDVDVAEGEAEGFFEGVGSVVDGISEWLGSCKDGCSYLSLAIP